MGEANNALKMYMNRQDRIQSVLEYYLGEKLPDDWQCRETGGFVAVRNAKVLNLMLYWEKEKWESPFCLKDMMEDMTALPEKLQGLAGDYNVHMISMRSIPEKDLERMDSDLKYVLGIMKRTASSKQYGKYIMENREYFSRIPRSAVDVIDACTNIKKLRDNLQYCINQESGEEEADLCKALDDIEKAAERKGERRGEKRGEKRGERKGTLMTLFSLVNRGLLRVEDAAGQAGMTEKTFLKKMQKSGMC